MEETRIQIQVEGKWYKAEKLNIFDDLVMFSDITDKDIQVILPINKIRRIEFSPDMEVGYQKTAMGLKLFSIAKKRVLVEPNVKV